MARKKASATRLRDLMAECESLLSAGERELLSKSGVCSTDLAILLRLSKKGPTPVNQLATKVGLTSGSMTTAVQRLKRRDLVTTGRQESDGRVVMVSPTETGLDLAKKTAKERDAHLAPLFETLNERESQILAGFLKRIRKAAK